MASYARSVYICGNFLMLKNAYSYGQRVYIVVPTNVFPVLYQLFCFMRCILPFDYIRFFALELINAVLQHFLIVLSPCIGYSDA
jgi:hypothetical protein